MSAMTQACKQDLVHAVPYDKVPNGQTEDCSLSCAERLAFGLLMRYVCGHRNLTTENSSMWKNVYQTFTNSVIPTVERQQMTEPGTTETDRAKIDMFKVVCWLLDSKSEIVRCKMGAAGLTERTELDGRVHKKRKTTDCEDADIGTDPDIVRPSAEPPPPSSTPEVCELPKLEVRIAPSGATEVYKTRESAQVCTNRTTKTPSITKDLLLRLATSTLSRLENWALAAAMPAKLESIPCTTSEPNGSAGDEEDFVGGKKTYIEVSRHLGSIQAFLNAVCLPLLSQLEDTHLCNSRHDILLLLSAAKHQDGNDMSHISQLVDAWILATKDLRARQRRIVAHICPPTETLTDNQPCVQVQHDSLKKVLGLPLEAPNEQVEIWYSYYSAVLDPEYFNHSMCEGSSAARQRLENAYNDWRAIKQASLEKKIKEKEEEKARAEKMEAEKQEQIALRRHPIQYILEMEKRRSGFDKTNRDNPFFILGVPTRIATRELVKKVSKTLYLLTHPDKCIDSELKESADAAFKLVTDASKLALQKIANNEQTYLFTPPLCPPFAASCGIPPHLFSASFAPPASYPVDPCEHLPNKFSWKPFQRPNATEPSKGPSSKDGGSWQESPLLDQNRGADASPLECIKAPFQLNDSRVHWECQLGLPPPRIRHCEVHFSTLEGNASPLPHVSVETITEPPYGIVVYVCRPKSRSSNVKVSSIAPDFAEVSAVYVCQSSTLQANLSQMQLVMRSRDIGITHYHVGFQTIDLATRKGSQIVWHIVDCKQPTKSMYNHMARETLKEMLSRFHVTAEDENLVQRILSDDGTPKREIIDMIASYSKLFWQRD